MGLHRPSGGSAELFGIDAWGDPVLAQIRALSTGNRQKIQQIAALTLRTGSSS